MKFTSIIVALAAIGTASAYSIPNRSTLRQLGQKSVKATPVQQRPATISSSLKMEDFGLFKGTKIGFDDVWEGPPKVADIWEALGFTATSNNEARQAEKLKAIELAREAKKGVLNGPGKEIRGKWLEKYGYPRLVGSGGIFYADQLSTDKVPMGGFNMGKSGVIWPVPPIVEQGAYGGPKGWGMKKEKGGTIDGLPPAKKV
ncbi:hypothetical protein ACA910_006005 [Epithemia clementina (nom. ined.)]